MSATDWNNKGFSLNELKRYEEAISCFDKAINLDPNYAYAWNNKGFSLNELKKYEEAITCFDKAINLDPNYAYAWNGKGNSLYELKKYEEAITCFDKAINLNPNHAYAWNGKGNSLYELKKYEEAITCFDKAINLDPNHEKYIEIVINKALAYSYLNNYNKAIFLLDQALTIDNSNSKIYMNKAKIFGKASNLIDAFASLNLIIEMDSKNLEAHEYRGDLYFELEDYEKALDDYKLVLEIEKFNDKVIDKLLNTKEKIKIINKENEENSFSDEESFNQDQDIFNDKNRNEINSYKLHDNTLNLNTKEITFLNSSKLEITNCLKNFSKMKSNLNTMEKSIFLEPEDKKKVEFIKNEMRNLEEENTCINTMISISISTNKDIKKTEKKIKGFVKKVRDLEINFKIIEHKQNIFESILKNVIEKIFKLEKETEYNLKNYEDKILDEFIHDKEKYDNIKDYIFGFKSTFSNTFITSQVIQTDKIQVNNSNIPITFLSCLVSFLPFAGKALSSGINSISEFYNEKDAKTKANIILQIANDNCDFSQKIGKLLEKIMSNKELKNYILKANQNIHNIEMKTEGLFRKIYKFLTEMSDEIKKRLYGELYGNSFKKLGFLHANLLIEKIYENKLSKNNFEYYSIKFLNENNNSKVNLNGEDLIKEDSIKFLNESYNSKGKFNYEDKKKPNCNCCILF